MIPLDNSERYKNHRFPAEIISHGVWLYYRFSLSYRDVEELLFERGITKKRREAPSFVCFRRACVKLDFHWPTVILIQGTR